MCTGMEWAIVSAAVTAAGTAANISAQNRAQAAQARAAAQARQTMNTEAAEQAARRQEAYASQDQAMQALSRGAQDQEEQDLTKRFRTEFYDIGDTEPGAVQANPLVGVQARGSGAVRQDAARRLADATNEAKKRIAGLARLTAGDMAGMNRGLTLADNASQIGMINNLQQGGLRTANLGANIQADAWKRPDTTLGDVLTTAGSLGMGYAGQMAGKAPGQAGKVFGNSFLPGEELFFDDWGTGSNTTKGWGFL